MNFLKSLFSSIIDIVKIAAVALILALTEVAKLDAADIIVNMDSQLVVRQMQGKYKIKDPGLKILAAEALKLIKNFRQVHFKYVPREQNRQADLLVNEAIDTEMLNKQFQYVPL